MIDKIKLALAALILIGGVYGYYQLPVWMGLDVSILLRVGLVLVSIIAAAGVVLASETGASFLEFAKGSRTELRKMVWPTGQEARQMTLIVLVLVVVIALFLWAIDAVVFELVYDWLLGVDS
ncbi:MAG TPA: preprotein translocase subunit SecE [Gammaproteobacteria bacterium]|jgi:preprotein translocase subunit SecE|nr:preprotein translocase subunit SecE [Gammaproteobacteria bacterium]